MTKLKKGDKVKVLNNCKEQDCGFACKGKTGILQSIDQRSSREEHYIIFDKDNSACSWYEEKDLLLITKKKKPAITKPIRKTKDELQKVIHQEIRRLND